MVQPPGFVCDGAESKVLSLHKALYSLCQPPHAWNVELDSSLAAFGFDKCPSEHRAAVKQPMRYIADTR